MTTNKISPVIVTLKALPGVRVVAVEDTGTGCMNCRIHRAHKDREGGIGICGDGNNYPNGGCVERRFYWREVMGNPR
jgi:hypothetical protein